MTSRLTLSIFLQPNGANLTGGGTGGAFYNQSKPTQSFIAFNGDVPAVPHGVIPAVIVGFAGAILGMVGVYGRLSI